MSVVTYLLLLLLLEFESNFHLFTGTDIVSSMITGPVKMQINAQIDNIVFKWFWADWWGVECMSLSISESPGYGLACNTPSLLLLQKFHRQKFTWNNGLLVIMFLLII